MKRIEFEGFHTYLIGDGDGDELVSKEKTDPEADVDLTSILSAAEIGQVHVRAVW